MLDKNVSFFSLFYKLCSQFKVLHYLYPFLKFKTSLRSIMEQNRLKGLALFHCHKIILITMIYFNEIINIFMETKKKKH